MRCEDRYDWPLRDCCGTLAPVVVVALTIAVDVGPFELREAERAIGEKEEDTNAGY